MAEAGNTKAKIDLEIRPTVFVALGGTGKEVLLRLRRRILQADWQGERINSMSEFPVAGFLYFDTDGAEARESGKAATTDPMAEAVAFGEGDKLQAKVDVAYYQRNKLNRPEIAEWLPSRDLAAIDVDKGAGQVRAISRLLFFDKFDQFKQRLQAKTAAVVDNVSTEKALAKLGIRTQRDLRVVVVASLAGGTGSGAFIDAGLAISSLQNPTPSQIDMFLVLPSGYSNNNRERVFANGYAALSELEHVMRPNPNPPYLNAWNSVEKPLASKPYKEVYLFDTQNINRDSTGRVDDLYDMMADILFEDFGSSDFARQKRSVSVNQEQHKLSMFYPSIDGDARQGALAFSRGYSAIGQSIVATTGSLQLEAAVSDAGKTMLQAFFGVWESSAGRSPSVKDRDAFIKDKLLLEAKIHDEFPEYLSPRPAAIADYALIERLMVSDDLKSIHGRIVEDISAEFRTIREQASDPKDWAAQVERVRKRFEGEVLARAGTSSIRKREVEQARDRVFRALTAEEAAVGNDRGIQSIRQGLFELIDDRENGGLDFTISLVEQVRDEFARDQTGVRARLSEAANQYRAVAETIMRDHLLGSLKKLETAAQSGGIFRRSDRDAAEKYMQHFEADLGFALNYWLRAIAAGEAQKLLDEIVNYLGERSAPDDSGHVVWTGLLRELNDGRQSVQAVIDMVDAEASRVRDAINRREGGMYIVIDQGTPPIAEDRTKVEPKIWAEELFTSFGGCRKILPMLRNDEERLKIINQLRSIAKGRLADEERKMPSVVDALSGLGPEEARKVLAKMQARAMPWIPANFDNFTPNGDQFKMIIAAPDANRVRTEFMQIILNEKPKTYSGANPDIVESGVKGRLICYCELSGFPLDSIGPLRDEWRKSYEKILSARDPIPLHNHHDYLRFPTPVIPSPTERAEQRGTMALFIRAVLYNVITRGANIDSDAYRDDARYYVDMSRHDLQSVGSERKIKAKGFDPGHRLRINTLIDQFESELTALQLIALASFAHWTARRAYAPPKEEIGAETEKRMPGLGHNVAMGLADELKLRAKQSDSFSTLPAKLDVLFDKFFGEVENYTVEITGSLDDLDYRESNRDLDDSPHARGRNKRHIDKARFTDDGLRQLLTNAEGAAARPTVAEAISIIPPPPPQDDVPISYFVAVNGQTTGPFGLSELGRLARDNKLVPLSKVYNALGGSSWVTAASEPNLSTIFVIVPPPPDQ